MLCLEYDNTKMGLVVLHFSSHLLKQVDIF